VVHGPASYPQTFVALCPRIHNFYSDTPSLDLEQRRLNDKTFCQIFQFHRIVRLKSPLIPFNAIFLAYLLPQPHHLLDMATPLSPATIKTSDEAFKYPLPTIRQFHRQLQVALDEKNARLRTLVGGSYRQLLGTAEMIVEMRRDIEVAESKLARVAEGCGRSAVGKRVAGLGKLGLARDMDVPGKVDLGWLARMKVLDGCVIVVGRLLRNKEAGALELDEKNKGRKLVTAAKVLVLSRLLIKGLGDEVKSGDTGIEGAADLVEDTRKKLGSLRRRLLRSVEKTLVSSDGEREDLAQALCAYSLATSSGSRDVLRHFLHVRGEAMALAFESDDEANPKVGKGEHILQALRLYTSTLLDVQNLVPRRLAESLLTLKGKPLLKDETMRKLEGLRLDVCERWFGDEILFFTPYIRHDDIDGPQAVEMLKGWVKRASEVLLQGFEKTLRRIPEFKAVVDLRTNVLQSWIRDGGKAKGFDSSVMLDGLRKVLNDHTVRLLETRIAKLHLVGTEVEAVLDTWALHATDRSKSLWHEELLEMELSGGAVAFKQSILSSMHGRSDVISRVIKGYETWLHLIDDLVVHIDQLKSQRWNDDLDSLEDDDVIEDRNALLSREDPQMLQDHVEESLERAYKDLHQKISSLWTSHMNGDRKGRIAMFILRVLRDIRCALPKRPDLKSFGLSMVPTLHKTLASSVASDSVVSLAKSISTRKKLVGRALWEGNPELPVQPSPPVFMFLHRLTSSMGNAGSDLWSPAAVIVLKHYLRTELGSRWIEVLGTVDVDKSAQANGHSSEDVEETKKSETPKDAQSNGDIDTTQLGLTAERDILIQSLFDVLVLQHCLNVDGSEHAGDNLAGLEKTLRTHTNLEDPLTHRLQQTAQEYWKRTSLLFGLLA
jgi:conserved oligomeric Golgi complex subunit 1